MAAKLTDQETIDLVLTLTELAEAIHEGHDLPATTAHELTDWAILLLDRHAEDE